MMNNSQESTDLSSPTDQIERDIKVLTLSNGAIVIGEIQEYSNNVLEVFNMYSFRIYKDSVGLGPYLDGISETKNYTLVPMYSVISISEPTCDIFLSYLDYVNDKHKKPEPKQNSYNTSDTVH